MHESNNQFHANQAPLLYRLACVSEKDSETELYPIILSFPLILAPAKNRCTTINRVIRFRSTRKKRQDENDTNNVSHTDTLRNIL